MLSQKLIDETFDHFNKHAHRDFVVNPSLPILYFGDLPAYVQSKLKIVTVGKNPSDNEFRRSKADKFSFFRFDKWNPVARNLEETLNNYFYKEPFDKWFSSYEPALNGFNASYYKRQENRAIHTDICSPIATFPTWSKLGANQQLLFEEGFRIWNSLMDELEPDLIIISVPYALYKCIITQPDEVIMTISKTKNGADRADYNILYNKYQLKNGKKADVIFGPAAQMPFGTISADEKIKIGNVWPK